MTRTHCALPAGGFWGREKSRRASERREAVSFPILFSRFMLHNGEPLGRAMSVTTLRDSRTHWNPRTPEGNKEKGGTTVHRRTGDEVAINGDYQDKALTRDPVVGRFCHPHRATRSSMLGVVQERSLGSGSSGFSSSLLCQTEPQADRVGLFWAWSGWA